MWLFWLAGALVIAAGLRRGGEPEPRFLVATGDALEIWHGAERETMLVRFDDGSSITYPAISEDGAMLAFVRVLPVTTDRDGKPDFGADLYVANADGSQARVIVRHGVLSEFIESPAWLRSGRELAYAIVTPNPLDGTADQRIEAVDIVSNQRRRLVANAEWPALMPDQRHLIFTSTDARGDTGRETPMLLDVDTGALKALPGYGARLIFINSYQRSPDGRLIAFAAAEPGEDLPVQFPQRGQAAPLVLHPVYQDIWLMDPDGSNLRRLADVGLATPSIAWSGDGAWVYVMSVRGFLRINVRTGTQEELGAGYQGGRIRLLTPVRLK